jgi:O-antigen/teichoic acid export membrane protein
MAFARQIAYNVVFSSGAKIASTVLALVSIGFITRYLGKEGFGNYATVLAFLSFFAAILDLGLNAISTREISRPGASEEKIMSRIFSLRVVSSFLVLLIVPVIICFFPYSREVKMGILIIAFSFLFNASYQILNGIFQKNLAMDKVAMSELMGKIIQVGIVILAVKYDLGFSWVILSLFFNMLVSFFLIHLWSRKFIKLKWEYDFQYWKTFLKESWPMGVSVFITFLYFKMDTILLSVMRSSADVGIYNAAYKVIENIAFFPSMIMGLILPVMSFSIFSDRRRFLDISNKTFRVFLLTVVPLLIIIIFLSDGIIHLIGGAGFFESALVLEILVFALVFIFFGNFFNAILIAANLQKKLMIVLSFAAILNISLNLIIIPIWSYLGAAVVSVITEFLVVVLTGFFVFKKINYKPSFQRGGQIILSGLIMAIPLFFFRNSNFFILIISSSAIYLFCLWIFKVITIQEIKSLVSKETVYEYK